MPGTREIKIRFSGDSSGLAKAAADGEKSVGRFSGRTQKFAKVALAGVAALGAGLAAGLVAGVKGLQEGEEAEAKFNDALSRSTAGMRNQAEALKANAEQLQRNTRLTYEEGLAISTAIARHESLSNVVKKGITDAVGLTNVTADLATVLGVDGATAADQLAKALAKPESASRFLTKAGVDLSAGQEEQIKAWIKGGQTAKAQGFILDQLKAKTEGAATAAGETTAGQLVRAQNAFGEVQEQLAVGLLPVLTDLLGHLVKVTAWAQENPGKVKVVVITLGALAAVIGTVSAAVMLYNTFQTISTALTKVWTSEQIRLNLAFLANPIFLIVASIVALIAIIVLIATKTDWFQRLWSAAWGAIKGAVSGTLDWIRSNWPLLLAILTGPVGLAVLAIAKNKDRIIDFLREIPDTAKRLFSGLADILTAPFRAAIDGLKSVWNSTIGGKGIPSIGIGPFKTPGFTIPMLAKGGNITRSGLALVGEEGPELLNLRRGAQVTPLGDGGFGDVEVHIHATGPTLQDIVRVELQRSNHATKNAVRAGSKRAA